MTQCFVEIAVITPIDFGGQALRLLCLEQGETENIAGFIALDADIFSKRAAPRGNS